MTEGKPLASGKEFGKGIGRAGEKVGKGVSKAVSLDSDRGIEKRGRSNRSIGRLDWPRAVRGRDIGRCGGAGMVSMIDEKKTRGG